MREFGIRPNRELGQNFLVDSNILDVIGRAAELSRRTSCSRSAAGWACCREYLAERVAHVHVVEIDRGSSLRCATRWTRTQHDAALRRRREARPEALDPAPTKVVANLPYGVAATVILRTIELGACTRWVAMVQKEVGERFAAAPGTRRTASRRCWPSSRATCGCCDKVSRKVFHPVPNVDSVLVGLRRRPAPPDRRAQARPAGLRAPPQGARAIAGARARRAGHRDAHTRARGARPPGRRPRRALSPAQWRALWRGCASTLAPGKVNLCLLIGAPRPDGLHALVSLVQPSRSPTR